MQMLKFVDAVGKAVAISLVSVNLIQKQYRDIQLELLQRHIKFHPDQLKVWEKMKPRCSALH